MMPDEDIGGALTAAETSELQSLRDEMSDSRGRSHQGNWRNHYWNSEAKQQRYRDLLARQEAGATQPASASNANDARIKALIQSPDYWSNPQKQAEVRRLHGGDDEGSIGPSAVGGPSAEAVQAALGFGKAESAAAAQRNQSILDASDDAAGLSMAFDGLSDTLQASIWVAFAQPHRRAELIDSLSDADYREFIGFYERMTAAERHAAERAMGLR